MPKVIEIKKNKREKELKETVEDLKRRVEELEKPKERMPK